MKADNKPIIAITMGDAAGIGPEVVIKSLESNGIYELCCPIIIGDYRIIVRQAENLGVKNLFSVIDSVGDGGRTPGTIDILDLHNLENQDVITGNICPACGRAAMEYIKTAAEMVLRGDVQAMVTAPINKEAIKQAGYHDTGHLEYLARLTGSKEYATMLATGPLKVVHLTTHYSLKEACRLVTRDRIMARLKLIQASYNDWGIEHPRIGVAAMNPHGGESGLFGAEEIEDIGPAVEDARKLGIDARGPYPADTIFNRAIGGEFDVVLAMYHDQGHIPVKVHDVNRSYSVALGLPFVRTSVDHGTAFDIAGQGIANAESMVVAIRQAVKLVTG